jgi:Asp-tRNA(Asn)/Glu-tRNA(Gln) amidotransferase C subunit
MANIDNFKSIIHDFTMDLTTTFPEFSHFWTKWTSSTDDEYKTLFEYCMTVFPERFFDIMYQNAEIFDLENETNVKFLPDVNFKVLYNCEGVSENTKKTIWKYLQLLLFNVIGSVDDKSKFGDAAGIFEGIDENMLQDKLKETMAGLGDFFKKMEKEEKPKGEEGKHEFTFNPEDGIPNLDEVNEHLKGIFDGKIGKLAKELAEEISGDFSDMVGDTAEGTTQDVLKNLMKNPKKMMGLVKKVGDKLTQKMDSGEISKEEIMKEAGDIMAKMKEMGGGAEKLNELFKQFAGKGMRVDTNAMDRMTKKEETKERMRKKMEAKKNANFVFERVSAESEDYVYRVPGEVQPRSSAQQKLDDEKLIAEFENVKEPKKVQKKKDKSKKIK